VFGSVSRGEDTPGSDIDLLVDLPDGVTLFDLSRLEIELERIVGAKVDVVPVGGLRHNLAERVHAEAIPL
jgi:predicted nucleotidyltransferase